MAGRSPVVEVIKGAVAGAIATWAMSRVTTYLYAAQSEAARRREDRVRGEQPYAVVAGRAARLAGVSLAHEQREAAGQAAQWGLGIGAGVLYGLLRSRVPKADAARGLLFGTLFFLLVDELANPLFGLSAGPTAFPWQAHARGLAGHLAYGLAADTTLDLLDGAA